MSVALNPHRTHHAAFYSPPTAGDGRALALVHGNCQAESLRLLLDGETLQTIRIPPVHELTAGDLPHLHRWLARAKVLVSQPVRDDYRGLALGTAQLRAAASPDTRLIIVPIVRFAGLYPEQAIIRPPHDPAALPPLVPYHSLRTLAQAAGRPRPRALSPAAVARVADESRAQLRRRERAHGTVAIGDVFQRPSFSLMRTINHPGNPVWLTLAGRVRRALSISDPVADPGRALLDAVHAPRDPVVISAFGLTEDPDPDWHLDGRRISAAQVHDAHLEWYADHPQTIAAGLARHADTLTALGL